jgi:hypothetical protein
MTHAKAAAVATVSVPGMKSRVQRGRAKLRELLLACCEVNRDVRGRVMDFDGCSPEPSTDPTKAAEVGGCRNC